MAGSTVGFKSGARNRVGIQPEGVSQAVALSNFRHSWREFDSLLDITSAHHEGIQAKIASILRGTGTVSCHVCMQDAAAVSMLPWDLGIKAQGTGTMTFEFANRNYFTVPYIISEVLLENETAGGCDFTFNVELNAEAGVLTSQSPLPTYAYPSSNVTADA